MLNENIIQYIVDTKNISLNEIARKLEYDVSVISRVVNRKQKMSHRMAYKISEVFAIDLAHILKVEEV